MRHSMLLIFLFLAPVVGDAQVTVPGRGGLGVDKQMAQFDANTKAHVDALLSKWAAAIEARNAGHLEDCYDQDAVVILGAGGRLNGLKEIKAGYQRLMPRMTKVRVVSGKIVSSGNSASVNAELSFDASLATGGSYSVTMPVRFAMKSTSGTDYQITIQEGGDLVWLAAVTAPPSVVAPGAPASVRVRVTDASGYGVGGASLTFDVTGGHGTLSPAVVLTDIKGFATAQFAAGDAAETDIVRVRAAELPNEPIYITFRTGAPTP